RTCPVRLVLCKGVTISTCALNSSTLVFNITAHLVWFTYFRARGTPDGPNLRTLLRRTRCHGSLRSASRRSGTPHCTPPFGAGRTAERSDLKNKRPARGRATGPAPTSSQEARTSPYD